MKEERLKQKLSIIDAFSRPMRCTAYHVSNFADKPQNEIQSIKKKPIKILLNVLCCFGDVEIVPLASWLGKLLGSEWSTI
jgi:hypothetical protein